MFKAIRGGFQKYNPFIKTIKVVYGEFPFTRKGNCFDIHLSETFTPTTKPGINRSLIPLGFKATLPKHYRGVLLFRSSTALNYGYIAGNGIGEIEWDYSEEWKGVVHTHEGSLQAPVGTRLFQFYIEPVLDAPWYIKLIHIFAKFRIQEVKKLTTSRSGLGHTGK